MEYSPLTTDRLILREFTETDWQAVHEYASDPEVVRYIDWGPNTEKESQVEVRQAIRHQQEKPRKHYEFAMVLKEDNRLVGDCGIDIPYPESKNGAIYLVLNRDFWRKGYATEAALAVLSFGFGQLKLHRIFSKCHTENTACIHILEKIGMRREGHFRDYEQIDGEWCDTFWHAMLDREWQVMKKDA